MSLFDYPRINFRGTIVLSPATANNDDDAAPGSDQVTMPPSFGPFAGQPFGLIDSKFVRARTFGMSDEKFVEWVQQPQTLVGDSEPTMPSEWNYYGDLTSSATATVVGVQTAPAQPPLTAADPSQPLSSLISASLQSSGGICDVNSEGSPPATQFFIDQMSLTDAAGKVVVSGVPSKGACQWLNFFRNVNLQTDGGAGGYVYHVLQSGEGTTINIPEFPANTSGLIIRYYIYAPLPGTQDPQALAQLYASQQINPATAQIVGTIAPLLEEETIFTGPVGRLLVSNQLNIPTPANSINNAAGGPIMLAPAVLVVQPGGNTISVDFAGTFPENWQGSPGSNPKYDFGAVDLQVTGGGTTATVASVAYTDVGAGDACGWVVDFDISANEAVQQALKDPEAAFSLVQNTIGKVLDETPYYVVSNQQALYTEQFLAGTLPVPPILPGEYRNQGTLESATISVYHRGVLVGPGVCPPITVWSYQATPIQSPGQAVSFAQNFQPGDSIVVTDLSQPGNILFTFTVNDPNNPPVDPPTSYVDFSGPPWITNAPSISVRVLPNDQDFSRYYVNPLTEDPVGNAQLTFEVLYTNVLQTYYLLFPAMNQHINLSSATAVQQSAGAILARTDLSLWMTTGYMPRTRDLSFSRRRLLRAFCNAQPSASGPSS